MIRSIKLVLTNLVLVTCGLQDAVAQTVFVRGSDAALWTKRGEDEWTSLQSRLDSSPDVCQSGNTVVVAARSHENDVIVRTQTGGQWSDPRSLGGVIASDVSIICPSSGSARVFARGSDNALWTRTTDEQQDWISLGGTLEGAPDAAISPTGEIAVVARSGGNVWHLGWNGREWSSWRNLGGSPAGDPTIAWMTRDRAEIIFPLADGTLRHAALRPDGDLNWQTVPEGVVRGSPDATSGGNGQLDLVARGTDDAVWKNSFDTTRWSGWSSIGGHATSDPSALPRVVLAVPSDGAGGEVVVVPRTDDTVIAVPASTVIALPAGYGYYCSMSWPDGRHAFLFEGPDPCGALRARAAGGKVERAGIYSLEGGNNTLTRCGTFIDVRKGTGQSPLRQALAAGEGKSGCVFLASPAELPIFVRPYAADPDDPDADVEHTTGFDYAQFGRTLDASLFREEGSGNAAMIDRFGRAQTDGQNNHEGHDYMMDEGRAIHAVALGRVIGKRKRDTSSGPRCDPEQPEIYILHEVGVGEYQERFVSYYAHMKTMSVEAGDEVTAGQVIGTAGDEGCSTGSHLHLSITRLTNLTGARTLDFQLLPDGRGDTGMAGRIDPYGWQAPRHVDPWAWMYIGEFTDNGRRLRDPGAFSIKLWAPGEEPRATNW